VNHGPVFGQIARANSVNAAATRHAGVDNRGVSVKELAIKTARAMSTINAARTGWHNPHPVLVREIADAFDIPEADLAAMAGIDDATAGVPHNTST